jgi:hypothetical protein
LLVQKVNDLKFEIEYVRHDDTDEEQPAPDGSRLLFVARVSSANFSMIALLYSVASSPWTVSQLFAQFENKYASK